MLKRYYTLREAAEFLTNESGAPFLQGDIFDLARRELVTLSVFVSRRQVTLCNLIGDQCRIGKGGFQMPWLDAYIDLPAHFIDRNTSLPIKVGEFYRVRDDLNAPEIEPSLNALRVQYERQLGHPCIWYFCKHRSIDEQVAAVCTGAFEFDSLEFSEGDLLVPAEDLLALKHRQRGDASGSKQQQRDTAGELLTQKERTSVLKIIGGLVKSIYAIDIHASRLTRVGEILGDMAKAGVTVDEKTLSKWVKEAAKVIEK